MVEGILTAAMFLGFGSMIAWGLWFVIRFLWIMFGPEPKDLRRYRKPIESAYKADSQ